MFLGIFYGVRYRFFDCDLVVKSLLVQGWVGSPKHFIHWFKSVSLGKSALVLPVK